MIEKTIKIKDLFILQEELKEIFTNKLSILARYKISDFKKPVDEALVLPNETKDSLIKTFGTINEKGEINLPVYIDDVKKEYNPKFLEFMTEWNTVLESDKDILYTPIKMDLIKDIITDKPIEILFQFIEE